MLTNDFFSEFDIILVIIKNLVEIMVLLKMDLKSKNVLISLVSPWGGVLWILIMIYKHHLQLYL